MVKSGIIVLYGPPTSGKTALSNLLKRKYPTEYTIVKKYKTGSGLFVGYIKVPAVGFNILETLRYFTNVTERHGNKYGLAKRSIRKAKRKLVISTASEIEVNKIKELASKIDLPCVIIALTNSEESMLERLKSRKLSEAELEDRVEVWHMTNCYKALTFQPHITVSSDLLSLELETDIVDHAISRYIVDYNLKEGS